jgi:hypothetical protein
VANTGNSNIPQQTKAVRQNNSALKRSATERSVLPGVSNESSTSLLHQRW